jgi:signal transduction histidine kinase/ligand-binding sensor domain-containing protein
MRSRRWSSPLLLLSHDVHTRGRFGFMKPTLILRLVVYSLVGFALTLTASAEHLPIKVYTSADGLGSSFINSLMRDSRGFLWVCTRDGLSRFDGAHFVNYQVGDKNAPPGIEQILETSKGIYLIATTGGLYRFDPGAPVVAPENKGGERPILNAEMVSGNRGVLFEDRHGNLWVGGTALFRVAENGRQLTFQEVSLNLPSRAPGSFGISDICEAQDGSLWLATTWGLLRLLPDGRDVLYGIGSPGPAGLITVLEDRAGRIWVTGVNGVFCLKPQSLDALTSWGAMTVLDKVSPAKQRTIARDQIDLPAKPDEVVEYPDVEGTSGKARHLSKTVDGDIWIANATGVIDFDGHSFRTYTAAQGFIEGVTRIVEDGSGNMWLSGSNGLMRLNRHGLTSYGASDGLGDQYILEIDQTRDGKLYTLGSNFSLSFFDGQGFHTIASPLPTGVQVLWTSNPVFQDSRGEWWFLTNGKLYRFASLRENNDLPQRRPLATYDTRDGLRGDFMFHIFEDSRSDLWISTRGSQPEPAGLSRWNRATEKFYSFSEADGLPPNAAASSFAEDKNGNLWFGFYDGGLVRFANGRFTGFTTVDGLPRGLITALYSDRQGRVWVGSAADGLRRIDDPAAEHPHFSSVTSANGLASNNVRSIAEDLTGNLYIGTARGVDRLRPDGAGINHYSTNDGLAGDFVSNAFRDVRGAVWFGTPNGLSRLVPTPDQVSAPPPIWLSGLRIAGESRAVPELGTAAISNLELAPAQNNLQIDFLAIDFNTGEDLRFQYMLDGADRDWGAPTPLRTVNYANLAPGSYRFLVRAVNANGLASLKPAIVSFRVLAPVWRRWWFIAMAVIFVGAGVFSVDRYRLARVRERQQAEADLRRAREDRLVELERVRKRIASDLHDDIGSSLTQISLLSEVLNQRIDRDDPAVTQPLATIANSSRELVDAMSDIVWAINPKKDHLSDLTQRMRSLASEVFTACNIKFRFRTPEVDVDLPLGANLRREVFLIFKESINNTIKHSGASQVDIEFRVDHEQLFLRVADNGEGFDLAQENEGHGLISMRTRAEDIGSKLEIVSEAGKGTTTTLTVGL